MFHCLCFVIQQLITRLVNGKFMTEYLRETRKEEERKTEK